MSRLTAFAAGARLGADRAASPGRRRGSRRPAASRPGHVRVRRLLRGLVERVLPGGRTRRRNRPGGASGGAAIDPARELAEGRAQFGTGHDAADHPRRPGFAAAAVAPIFQESGAAIYYAATRISRPRPRWSRRGSDACQPAISSTSNSPPRCRRRHRPGAHQIVTVEPGQVVAALAERTIDAAPGSAWMLPWQAHERGRCSNRSTRRITGRVLR